MSTSATPSQPATPHPVSNESSASSVSGERAIGPGVGLGVLHLFFRIPAGGPQPVDAAAVSLAVKSCQADSHQVVSFAVLGHKADLGFMALGSNLWRLRRLQSDLVRAGLELVDSYVSMTEASEYTAGMPEEMLNARLYPTLPPNGMKAVCFYPMSKKRGLGEDHNWFTLPFDDRNRLMREHGTSGRKFHGKVTQMVTGSTGLDNFEWAVTLFAHDPADLKHTVYAMRFDEASAVYAEFGLFLTGMIAEVDELLQELL